MLHSFLEFRGSFRYRSHDALDQALCEARDHLDDDQLCDVDREWMRYLSRTGLTVHVEAILPDSADPYVAAAVLGSLSRPAVEGRVHVTRGMQVLDTFASPAEQEVVA
jgi:hypothetical protein